MSHKRIFLVTIVWFIMGALAFEVFSMGLQMMNQSNTFLFYIGILVSAISIVAPVYLIIMNPGLTFKK